VAVDVGSFPDCMRAPNLRGTYWKAATPVRTLPGRWAALMSGKTIVTGGHPSEEADDLVVLKGLIEEGVPRSAVDRRYPLERLVEGHRYVDRGGKTGNAVIAVERTAPAAGRRPSRAQPVGPEPGASGGS
jgi:hypothetical protein